VVSGTVFQQAKNKVQSIFDDLGEHNFKNIAEPVRAYRIRIDPDDQLIHIANPIRRAFWRGAMIAAGIILVLEIAAFGTWYQFIRKPSPIEVARKTSAELQARLKLNPLPQKIEPGTIFRECADCPEMMIVPAGSFMMGAAEGEGGAHGDEGPLHEVRIETPFAIGRFEVTYAEWDACVAANGCNYSPQDRGWGRGNLPVTYANWVDIQSYLMWLSSLTGHHYRLPSEAEWEYAARAGSPSSFSWGEKMVNGYANCAGCGAASGDRTMPVGSLKPNAFGLFDMHGNVWEWTADCWNGSFANAPRNGTAWNVGDCDFRVLKGGAWGHEPNDLRSARRVKDKLDLRSGRRGFRVVMTLP
jgi:formylglycine-generating enzyme required for sulfatase activity